MQYLTPALVDEVNRLVDQGAHFSLSMFDVPLVELDGATNVKVWAKTAHRDEPYLSSSKDVDGFNLDLFTAGVVPAQEVARVTADLAPLEEVLS